MPAQRADWPPQAVAQLVSDNRRTGRQRLDTPIANLIEKDIERRLVELDHAHASSGYLARCLIENLRELPCQPLAAAIVLAVERIDHGHRTGQGKLDRVCGFGAKEARALDIHRLDACR